MSIDFNHFMLQLAYLNTYSFSCQQNNSKNADDISVAIDCFAKGEIKLINAEPSKNEFYKIRQCFNRSMAQLTSLINELTLPSVQSNLATGKLSTVMERTAVSVSH